MALLNKEALLASNSLQSVDVDFAGGTVRVREMSTSQRMKVGQYNQDGDSRNATAYALISSLVDEADAQLLTNMKDAYTVMDNHGTAIDELSKEIAKLNGMTDEAIDEAAKN